MDASLSDSEEASETNDEAVTLCSSSSNEFAVDDIRAGRLPVGIYMNKC